MEQVKTVGVYGLGRFGVFWAKELARHGFDVVAWSRSSRTVPEGVRLASEDEVLTSSALICLILLVTGWLWVRLVGENPRSVLPALVFMNSGFLGIPLMKLWGGNEAMNLILIFDQMQGIFMFSIGILIITGGFNKKSFVSLLHSPIIWAMVLGFIFNLSGITIPAPIATSLFFVGEAASPLACVALGISIRHTRFTFHKSLFGSLLFRFVGGWLIGLLVVSILGLTGLVRTITLVAAALPSAMFTSILPLRYEQDNQYASMMVVISTLLGVVTIPLSFALAA